MLLRQLVSPVAQQLLCACITADMHMHNTCCACGGQLLCANNYPDLIAHPLSCLSRKYRNPLPYFLYNAYHFVVNSNPRYCARHRTMLDMKITGADTAQRYSYDGIMLIYYRRLPFFCEAKLSLLDICKCFHLNYIYKYYYSR